MLDCFYMIIQEMNHITISKFRGNLAEYLESSKIEKKPLIIGKRNRQEFIIIPLNEENKKELSETSFKNELGEYKKGPISSLNETKLSLTSKVQPPKEWLPFEERNRTVAIIKHPNEEKFLLIKDFYGITFPWWWVEQDESLEEAARREIQEETWYQNILQIKETWIILDFYRNHEEGNRLSKNVLIYGQLENLQKKEGEFESFWISKENVYKTLETDASKLLRKTFLSNEN